VDQTDSLHPRPFLLMQGGPLFNLQKHLGLIKDSSSLIKRRALWAALLTWFPLLILSAIQGRAFGHAVPLPFLQDFSTYTRFLFAMPLLLLGENILGPRIAESAEHFITSGLILEKDWQRFDDAIERGLRLRDSVLAESILVILAYIFSLIAFKETAVPIDTWYATRVDGHESLTWAGIWLMIFCVPVLQFLILRWLWRLFLWFQFLSRVRKMDIQLFPTHPDRAGGLGFVGEAQRFFGIVLFAFSLGAAGVMANDIVYGKTPLQNFAPAIGVYVAIALIIVVGPLVVFTQILFETKFHGLHEYGALATNYTGSFHKKWIQRQNTEQEALLGTGDIQSLADMGNSYSFIEKMKFLPVDLRTLLQLIIASLLPMIPLLTLVIPLREILKFLFKVLM
jgi:hypothetical protein